MVKQYLEHSKAILSDDRSEYKHNTRTGMGHISLFGYQNIYDLRRGFPLLTTKKMKTDSIVHELVWFLKGDTNIKYLVDNNTPIWNDNAFTHNLENMVNKGVFSGDEILKKHSEDWFRAKDEYVKRIGEDSEFAQRWGDLGPVYGSQWIHWDKFNPSEVKTDGTQLYEKDKKGVDQIARTIESMKKNPTAKRYIISAWNPNEVPNMALPPCHTIFHVASNGEQMDLQLYQRSCDMFLGVPFNIASYAMLTKILAQQLDLEPRHFIHSFGDVHFYTGAGERSLWYKNNLDELKMRVRKSESTEDFKGVLDWVKDSVPSEDIGKELQDHVPMILKQLTREPKPSPTLNIPNKPYNELTFDDFSLTDYDHHKFIKAAIAV